MNEKLEFSELVEKIVVWNQVMRSLIMATTTTRDTKLLMKICNVHISKI